MLDDELPHLVVQVQVGTGDEAGDDDDGGAADQLLLSWPFDLLQLCPGLLEEADAGGAGADLVAALATRGGRLSRRLLLGGRARPGRGPERRRAFGLRAALAALLTGRAGHYYRVSRCSVWLPHQRQYLRNSTRSGELRFDF